MSSNQRLRKGPPRKRQPFCGLKLFLGEILTQGQAGPCLQVALQNVLVQVEVIGILVVLVDHEVATGLVEALVAADHPDEGITQTVDGVQNVEVSVVGVAVDALTVGGVVIVDVTVIENKVHVLELIVETVIAEILGDPEGQADVGVLTHMDGAAADVLQVVNGLLHRVEVLTVVGLAECALYDYLTMLGFKQEGYSNSKYALYDCYDHLLCDLEVQIADGTTTGTIVRHVNRANSMQLVTTESPFTDLDSAIASVNAILATYMAAVGAQATNILGKITTSRSALMLDRTFDVRTLEEYTAESKDKMIRVLETELKQLKGE